ncbi:MAG: RagB/SusD family nutrient uptake outer membrane protein [Prevotella sp.]|nr:RagB/SusD family nutrient uptake outer membrane protein [Prevotella sp.]
MITKINKIKKACGSVCCGVAVALAALSLSSCANDFLEQENTYQISQSNFFSSDDAVSQEIYPLYSYVWYMFNDKFYYGMGDGRANNITAQYSDYIYPYTNFTETGLSNGLTDAWGAFYSVVAQANNAINNIQDFSTSGVSETAKTQGIAEARFMRGVAYWYIASLWGCAIIYENTQDLVNNYVVAPSRQTDAMEFAIRDLEYAAVNLPASSPGTGRVNKYAAYAMLSRVYLSMAGLTTDGRYDGSNIASDKNRGTRNNYYLDAAKKAAATVIEKGPYKLLDSFADLFDYKTQNNNEESIFQLQWQAGAPAGLAQSMTRFLAWSTQVNQGNSWGGSTYCSYDLWEEFKEYNDPTLGATVDDAVRRHYSVASYGEAYPELSTDPDRPYIYGETENAGSQGANIKKYVIGTNAVNGIAVNNNSGINTYMMRLAEVYLNYAEATLGNSDNTSDATALGYFNALRQRAGVAEKSKISYEDIRHEFRVETAFEGLYWFFLVRRGYYQQQEVVNYVNNQHRNASYYTSSTHEYKLPDTYAAPGPSVAVATAANLTLPIADTDQTKNPLLKPDANGVIQTVAYEFGEREVTDADLF